MRDYDNYRFSEESIFLTAHFIGAIGEELFSRLAWAELDYRVSGKDEQA